MKRVLFAISVALAAVMLVANVAEARKLPTFTHGPYTHKVKAHVISSKPIYKPGAVGSQKVCKNVKVAIYAGNGNQAGNILTGALIGGVLGQVVTGNKNGATTGAIIGGIAGSQQPTNKIVGYKTERQCSMVAVSTSATVKYYQSRVRIHNKYYRIRTSNHLTVGGTLTMYMPN